MPIAYTGAVCARRGCQRPEWKDGLCGRCWRLARFFGRDPRMFAYEPLDGYADALDTVSLPWDEFERRAAARGLAVADLLAEPPEA